MLVTYKSLSNFTMSHYSLNIKNWNYVFIFLATVFILSSGVLSSYAAPDSPPTLKLVKSVIKDDHGSAVADEWNLFAHDGTTQIIFNRGGSGIFEEVSVGTKLTLSESEGPGGYESGLWSCNGGDFTPTGEIILAIGDRVTCTITSDDVAPTLNLVKKLIINDGGIAFPSDWTLSATGTGGGKRNFSGTGTISSEDPTIAIINSTVFANVPYGLAESDGPLGFTAENNGRWNCVVTYPNGFGANFSGVSSIRLNEGDVAFCTITNNDDVPSVSIEVPSKISGKVTITATVKGFEDIVPVSFKVYKMDGTEKSIVYEGYVASAPYSFTIPAKNLDAGSSYEVIAGADDGKGKSASKSAMVNIPTKGNAG